MHWPAVEGWWRKVWFVCRLWLCLSGAYPQAASSLLVHPLASRGAQVAGHCPPPPAPPAGEDFAFAEQVQPLRDAAPPSTRWVFATATLPEQVFMDLEEVRGGARVGAR